MSTTPVLIAPRPVRLTTDSLFTSPSRAQLSHSTPSRIKSTPQDPPPDAPQQKLESSTSVTALSPHSSPKQEVLEEFLSIFRSGAKSTSPPPAATASFLFPPSPTKVRSFMPYRHHHTSSLFAVEELSDLARATSPLSSQTQDDDEIVTTMSSVVDVKPNWWFYSGNLSSPISRMHTRNPFQRHPSYDLPTLARSRPASSCGRASICVSPADIPLPTTPEV